jgi:hypothetical protein
VIAIGAVHVAVGAMVVIVVMVAIGAVDVRSGGGLDGVGHRGLAESMIVWGT